MEQFNFEMKMLMSLDIQFFAVPIYTPPNVLLSTATTGTVPTETGESIIEEVMAQSAVMQLAQFEEMEAPRKEFSYLAGGIGAYWVSETERIRTSRPTWVNAVMEAHKLGVIIPVSKEFLNYTVGDFFDAIRPTIAQAFYTKFDQAALFGIDTPYVQSIIGSATNAGNVVTEIAGESMYAQLNGLLGLIEDNELDPNGFATTTSLRQRIRGEVDTTGRPIFNDPRGGATADILGLPIAYVNGAAFDRTQATILAADWDYARYGVLQDIEYRISQDAQLSTIVDELGNPVNLFERDMFALRATAHFAFMVLRDEAFAALAPAATTTPA